ncbi:MAG: hypothetical protein HOP03_00325 [Lysobacter sp.]|nr:hypothetical protein [Lysobacter sp.]
MKRYGFVFTSIFALGLGVGASMSAYGYDPSCLASCQEQLNDCRAQVVGDPQWNSRHCNVLYRACVAACSE